MRVLASVKSNLGRKPSALGFKPYEAANGAVAIEWLGEIDFSADDLVAAPMTGPVAPERESAAAFVALQLRDGPVPADELRTRAEADGRSWRTVERAKRALRVVSQKSSFGSGWEWRLPPDDEDRQLHNVAAFVAEHSPDVENAQDRHVPDAAALESGGGLRERDLELIECAGCGTALPAARRPPPAARRPAFCGACGWRTDSLNEEEVIV